MEDFRLSSREKIQLNEQFFGSTWNNFFNESKAVIIEPKKAEKKKPEYVLVENGKKSKLVRVVKLRGSKK